MAKKKMNLDFLLSHDKDNNNNNGHDGRHGRTDGTRPDSTSPLSLEFIAPRASDPSARVSAGSSMQLSKRFGGESSSTHLHLQSPQVSPPPPQRTSSARDQTSSARFKTKKTKSSSSPSAMRNPSAGEVKPHVCPSCDRSFYKLEQLKRHDRLVHLNLRPFVCTTCDLSFGTKQNMQVHLTTRKHQHRLETLQASHRSSHGGNSRQQP